MLEEIVLQGVPSLSLLGSLHQFVDPISQGLPEPVARLTVRLAKLFEQIGSALRDGVGDPAVDSLGDPPAAAGANRFIELLPVLFQPSKGDIHGPLEENIGVAAGCKNMQGAA